MAYRSRVRGDVLRKLERGVPNAVEEHLALLGVPARSRVTTWQELVMMKNRSGAVRLISEAVTQTLLNQSV